MRYNIGSGSDLGHERTSFRNCELDDNGLPIHERASLQLRFEFFNLTNTPHFANPNGNMVAGNFGSITQTIGNPRIVQFAAKIQS